MYETIKKAMIENYCNVQGINKAFAVNGELIERAYKEGKIGRNTYYLCIAFNLDAVELLEDEGYQ